MTVPFDLSVAAAGLIAFAVLLYVVLDGFDLGIGILLPALADGEERDQALNSVAPVWDGNETWLVMGGALLFAAFPLAYALVLPATYPLIIAMLLALVFRGTGFEFRWRDPRHRRFWDFAVTSGSFVAALAQGIILGALIQGVSVRDRAYAGGWLDWLSPYSLLTGLGVVCGYVLLGACWLALKAEGKAEDHGYRIARLAAFAVAALMIAVSLATPFLFPQYYQRWFSTPSLWFVAPVPVLTGLAFVVLLGALAKRRPGKAFLAALALFLLGMAGLGISIFPAIVPPSVSIWDAAAPERSQHFVLVGALFIVPILLAYTGWAYWVFRGKVGTDGYH
ncbi:cytochrome d ubiquinol oxidase subunit II [Parablastomonas sp. CN1-191]|uniref:cytochrome d ubiquinol oxidase subunit II n=1 Tax=Parablastomonas sp. CN1-191 TaxID=3400908 RepID=UPI003BF7B7B5